MYISRKSEGYTLIELIVSTALIGIVASILVYVMVSIIGILQDNQVRKQLLMDGYNATAKFVRECELIDKEADLLSASTDQVQFITNISDSYFTITYQIINGELQRTVDAGSPVILTANVSGQFEYYTKNHISLAPPLSSAQLVTVRRVRLILNMLNDGGGTVYIYTVDAFPENYRFSGGGS